MEQKLMFALSEMISSLLIIKSFHVSHIDSTSLVYFVLSFFLESLLLVWRHHDVAYLSINEMSVTRELTTKQSSERTISHLRTQTYPHEINVDLFFCYFRLDINSRWRVLWDWATSAHFIVSTLSDWFSWIFPMMIIICFQFVSSTTREK